MSPTCRRRYTTILLLLVFAHLVSADLSSLQITASPRVAFEPSPLIVWVRLQPEADDRELAVNADSGVFYRESSVPLEGLASARHHRVEWRDLPAGAYAVRAAVGRPNHWRAFASTTVLVLER